MKRTVKKLLSALLVLVMAVSLLPATALAAANYNVWVEGIRVNGLNANNVMGDGTVVFTAASGSEPAKLTLKNANITGAPVPEWPKDSIGIYSEIDLVLELIGDSTVTAGNAEGDSVGILVLDKDLTITGSGTLNVSSGRGKYSSGINTDSMTMLSGTVRATAGSGTDESEGVYSNDFVMEGGALTTTGGASDDSWGVGGDFTMNGGTLTATGQTRAFYSEPYIGLGMLVRVNPSASAEGAFSWYGDEDLGGSNGRFKYVKIEQLVWYDVWVEGYQISNNIAGDVMGDFGSVVFTPATESEPAKLTLKNANLTGAPVPEWPGDSIGIYSEIDLTLELIGDSTVTAGNADGDSEGILVLDKHLTVTGNGTLNVSSGNSSYSCALNTNSMTMLSGTIRATAGSGTRESEGVYSNNLVMEGGALIAAGGASTNSWGVGGRATLNGGTVTAIGQTLAFYTKPDLSGYHNPAVSVGVLPAEIGAKAWNGTDALGDEGSGFKYVKIAPNNPFTDVPAGQYFYDPVLWAVSQSPQITTGTSPTTFSPNATCTRAQVVTFLWRASGSPEPTLTINPFKDVPADQYYYKAVLWAVEKGITTGTSATAFNPNAGCTRGQVVTFLHRAQGTPAPGSSVNPFTDVPAGQYYYDAVLWAVNHSPQITNGTSATTFSPNATCTRGQIVTFLYRAMA